MLIPNIALLGGEWGGKGDKGGGGTCSPIPPLANMLEEEIVEEKFERPSTRLDAIAVIMKGVEGVFFSFRFIVGVCSGDAGGEFTRNEEEEDNEDEDDDLLSRVSFLLFFCVPSSHSFSFTSFSTPSQDELFARTARHSFWRRTNKDDNTISSGVSRTSLKEGIEERYTRRIDWCKASSCCLGHTLEEDTGRVQEAGQRGVAVALIGLIFFRCFSCGGAAVADDRLPAECGGEIFFRCSTGTAPSAVVPARPVPQGGSGALDTAAVVGPNESGGSDKSDVFPIPPEGVRGCIMGVMVRRARRRKAAVGDGASTGATLTGGDGGGGMQDLAEG